ncbi:TonB-dependent receptor plug domain-containing protein [Shewanella algae]|uniref:TonB-dependent receptor plug domain-containing protein n=1 Tax=Shewanella algae TaxID=38313 RepID=UPI003005D8D4
MQYPAPSAVALAVAAVLFCAASGAETLNKQAPSSNESPETSAVVTVKDRADNGLDGKSTLDEQMIRRTPSADGNLSDLVKSNPAVRLEGLNEGFSGGEIKPSKISIYGAESEQTAFLIDGININNDLDPSSGLFDGSVGVLPGMSSEQAYFFDAAMLAGITVYDNNVPASLGGFTGGAVVADTLSYNGVNGGQLLYRTSRSSWTSQKVDPSINEFLQQARPEGGKAIYQPDFVKHSYSGQWQQGINDELGMVLAFGQRRSSIRQSRIMDAEGTVDSQDQSRRSDNLLLNLAWTPDPLTRIDWDWRYSAYREGLFMGENIDNDFEDSHSALGSTLSLEREFSLGSLSLKAAYDSFEDERHSQSDTVLVISDADSGLDYQKGGYGDSRLKQRNLQLLADVSFKRLYWGDVSHSLETGLSFQQTDYDFYRPREVNQEIRLIMSGMEMPLDEQTVLAGSIDTRHRNSAAYLQDTIKFGAWQFRPGLRLEHDDYLNNLNLAPRLALNWDVVEGTRVDIGLNRYYGRSFASMKLADEILKLSQDHTRRYESIKDLKTPFSDELTLALHQNLGNLSLSGRYTLRDYRDRLVTHRSQVGSVKVDDYRNGEDYKVHVYTLQLNNIAPLTLGASQWEWSLAADWLETDRNDLDKAMNPDEAVMLDGVMMSRRQMEQKVNSSQEEWMVRLGLDMELPAWNITWGNKLYVKAPVRGYESVNSQAALEMYRSYDFGSHTQWDSRIRWEPQALGGEVYLQLDINNVLNQVRQYSLKANQNGEYGLYTPGRQFWLEVGYRF